MDIIKDIQPMATFRNHSAEFDQHLRVTKRPMVLTVDGKAAAVVQVLDLTAAASVAEGIRQGLEDVKAGRSRSARMVFDEIRGEHGIPR